MEFRILGPLEVVHHGRSVALGGPKQRAVLAQLVVAANRPVPAERLIEQIWGEEAGPATLSSLHSYISRLRRGLPRDARIEWQPPGYVLRVDPAQIDALHFETAIADARRLVAVDAEAASAGLEQALALWRGTPLVDVPGEGAAAEARRLEELRLSAIEERVAVDVALGRDASVIALLEATLAEEPLRERLWASLMLALYRAGRQAEALEAYHKVRSILDAELGVAPSPELEELQGKILLHDPQLRRRGLPLRGYQLLERIGAGMFGVVHRAIQPHVGREVALKAIHPHLAHHPDFIRRFEAEAQLVARLENPRIVPIYDYWRDEQGAFLVMRWLRGGSLAARLAAGPYDADAAALLIEQLALGLAAAHRNGVVHRDLKPANILLDDDGDAYLSDFGIAKDLAATSPPRSPSSSPYLAPEEIRREPVTARTDIYAAGLVLWELLTARPPETPIRARNALRSDLPASIGAVLAKALADDPRERHPDAETFAAEVRAALNAPASAGVESRPLRNPYKGLNAFQAADAGDFHGRAALVQRLTGRLADPGPRLLALVGPSGSGKSSVLRAGLIPAILDGQVPGSERWFVSDLFPGADPTARLAEALAKVSPSTMPRLAARLAEDERGLIGLTASILPDDGSELLIVIDQFEELFTLVESEDVRRRFLDLLATTVVDEESRVRVAVTLRADFYDRALAYPRFGNLLAESTEAMPPLSAAELEEAILAPAEGVGLELHPRLVAALIAETHDRPGGLPLLEYALTELFERRQDHALTADALAAVGGVAGSVGRRAEQIFDELPVTGHEAARQVFLRLVAVGPEAVATRRRVRMEELAGLETDRGAVQVVLDAYGRHRLLAFDRDAATRQPTVELAHEAVISEWSRLHGWISAAREEMLVHQGLAAASAEWLTAKRDPSFLARGSRLGQLDEWASTTGIAMTGVEREFLDASLAQREAEHLAEDERRAREVALERRAAARVRALAAVLAVAAVVSGGLALFAFGESQRAEREARLATARELSSAALANLSIDPELSILLALEAVEATRVDGLTLREAQEALHASLQTTRVVSRLPAAEGQVLSHDGRYLGVPTDGGLRLQQFDDDGDDEAIATLPITELARLAVSADERYAATGGVEGPPSIWDLESGRLVVALPGEAGFLDAVAFSPTGSKLAAMTIDGSVRVWAVPSGDELLAVPSGGGIGLAWSADGRYLAVAAGSESRLYEPPDPEPRLVLPGDGRSVALSPDGSLLLTTGESTVNLWDARTGEHLRSPTGHSGWVNAATFSRDGRSAATGAHDGVARVWDVETGEELLALTGQGASVDWLTFSADGGRLRSWGATGSLAWDLTPAGSRELLTFGDHDGMIPNVAYSPDGSRIATAGFDGRAVLWEAETGALVAELRGHGASVTDIVFSPDGDLVATASFDGTARLWSPAGDPVRTIEGHEGPLWAVSFSSDGRRLVTASEDRTARSWEVDTGREIQAFAAHADHVYDAAWSPLGSVVVSVGNDFQARIWDPVTGDQLAEMRHDENVVEQAFSADGSQVGTASFDGTARIWEVPSGNLVLTLSGHGGIVLDIESSPDGSAWATASLDGTVRLWDAASGEELLQLVPPVASGRLAFSPDGRHLAAAGDDGMVRIFTLDLSELVDLAKARLTRGMTDAECRQFLHVACGSDGEVSVLISRSQMLTDPARATPGLTRKWLESRKPVSLATHRLRFDRGSLLVGRRSSASASDFRSPPRLPSVPTMRHGPALADRRTRRGDRAHRANGARLRLSGCGSRRRRGRRQDASRA